MNKKVNKIPISNFMKKNSKIIIKRAIYKNRTEFNPMKTKNWTNLSITRIIINLQYNKTEAKK